MGPGRDGSLLMLRSSIVAVASLAVLAGCAAAPTQSAATSRIEPGGEPTAAIVLRGTITGADRASYRELAFDVPPGVRGVTITVDHDQKGKGAVLDLGLRDPAGFRGWSGSNKSEIFLSEYESTPSFRAGPILPGEWKLILGVPAIRDGQTATYAANIRLDRAPTPEPEGSAASPARVQGDAGRWLRGDLHTHTGHSDGSCPNGDGVRTPCPVHRTLEAAVRAGLDFVAVTDHNTFAQNASIRELEGHYPGLIVIRGAEITTFQGHANALGTPGPLDFQLGGDRLPHTDKLLDQIASQGGILSINHPGLPSGPACMGCGWTAKTDWRRVAAIEVMNGAALRTKTHEGPASGIRFWEALLDQGHRLTAVGGSDNHDATAQTMKDQAPIGAPATVVWAAGKSTQEILAGIRSGRVFVDLDATPEKSDAARTLDISATADGAIEARMGDTLMLDPGALVQVAVEATGVDGARFSPSSGGMTVEATPTASHFTARLLEDINAGWLRFDVRDADGQLLLVGNPVYFVLDPQWRREVTAN